MSRRPKLPHVSPIQRQPLPKAGHGSGRAKRGEAPVRDGDDPTRGNSRRLGDMKKVLLATVALALMTGIAQAEPRLPQSMYGLWCPTGEADRDTTRYARGKCRKYESDGYLEVGAASVDGHEWGCDLRRILPRGRAYEALGDCISEATKYDQVLTFRLEGRRLHVRYGRQDNVRPEMAPLTCRDFELTPPEPEDDDPVERAVIDFRDTFGVTHVTRSGKKYIRADQYKDVRVWLPSSGDGVVSWSGTWRRNPSRRMVGTLVSERGGYSYVERFYDGARLETEVRSACMPVDGASGSIPGDETTEYAGWQANIDTERLLRTGELSSTRRAGLRQKG